MKRVEIHPAAIDEANEAYEWYATRDERVASEFKAALRIIVSEIASMPGRFPRYIGMTQKAVMGRFPYLIVYREEADRVQIVAVAHGRRRPGYWAARLK